MSKQKALDILTEVYTQVKEGPEPVEVVVFIKQGSQFALSTTTMTDAMQLVSAIELCKFAALQRMTS